MPEPAPTAPPDQDQRMQALDPASSILVQAPAGSGKTDLLARRFLRLLAEVDDPAHIVAITFTRAAAVEMRNRILAELENAVSSPPGIVADEFSMQALACRALQHSRLHAWNLIDLSEQLRISTIDSFCGEIAARQPLLTALGSGLTIEDNPDELYRRAARETLMQLSSARHANDELGSAIDLLLTWRDNAWSEIEDQLVQMLARRDQWMQDFVLAREQDWNLLRERLERPFARASAGALTELSRILETLPSACAEALDLARFACAQTGNAKHRDLAELAEFPCAPFASGEELESARQVFLCLADFLLIKEGTLRQRVDISLGFPADRRREKQRMLQLTRMLADVTGFESALASVRTLPPARYTNEEWEIVRACFTLLHHASGQLRVVFAEAGVADFIEVAQTAHHVLQDENHLPTDAALAIADGIHHLLVDEFQDTSRRQHQLIAALVAAWPDPARRTLFVVGDPMQSIYSFRDADAELFPRVQSIGLELPDGDSHPLHNVRLASNFRTAPQLVAELNRTFRAAFADDDGSGIQFNASEPARPPSSSVSLPLELHVDFVPQRPRLRQRDPDSVQALHDIAAERESSRRTQIGAMVALIRTHLPRMLEARARGERYRIAILGRAKAPLAPIAEALRDAAIPFRAVELEPLIHRPEVLDALALARALFCAEDRVAWLGILRAPWCGLSLQDLHTVAGDGDLDGLRLPIPQLLRERAHLLGSDGSAAAARLLHAFDEAPALRSALPTSALGTWLEQVWIGVGGAACVNPHARANLDMLWRCLDRLPNGEPDLLGPALAAALDKLSAQADPAAETDTGVQLMTIHKSKGLEFEVVIVPGLHARSGRSPHRMLSWLERGLAEPVEPGEITEFLIAPIQPRGGDRGKAKEWVDREIRERERREMRRIFYVASTRAREALHLFARVEFKPQTGQLCEPAESLLSVAWPAFESDVRNRFAAWQSEPRESVVAELAAAANVVPMPAPQKHALLHRLPPGFRPRASLLHALSPSSVSVDRPTSLFSRHEGGLVSRALGTAVHSLMEELARLHAAGSWDHAPARLERLQPQIVSRARAAGMDRSSAENLARHALEIALRASQDPVAAWILSPHPEASSEARWTGVANGLMHTVQVDRVFRAGLLPQAEGSQAWWIVDYKSSHPDALDTAGALPRLRPLFAPQLEAYAEVLRGMHGRDILVRAGLYYPRLLAFDWWEI